MRSGIEFRIVSVSPSQYSESAEHLLIELTLHCTKILLGVFYSPNLRVNYFECLDELLSNHCSLADHIIVMGDFNTCMLKNDFRSKQLLSVLSSHNLRILPVSATHHFPNCTPSLLDLMMVSSSSSI
ncbi:hypothetical protein F3H09_31320, partial [Pseudomonas aeruginosa]